MNQFKPDISRPDQDVILPVEISNAGTNLVLVVSGSRVTAVVAKRIVERTGLKCACIKPAQLDEALSKSRPAAVILDDEPQAGARIADHRRAKSSVAGYSGAGPTVILLATNGPVLQAGKDSAHIDAVIAKPITPDNLQPVLYNVLARIRS
jgi:CheY-like chemotaxis protein